MVTCYFKNVYFDTEEECNDFQGLMFIKLKLRYFKTFKDLQTHCLISVIYKSNLN